MTHSKNPLQLYGAPGSPYTRKMLALLRYRRIPHAVLWGTMADGRPDLPKPKVGLLPTFYFETGEGVEAVVDSTPIIRRLEAEYAGRSVLPADPALRFINALLEDFGDEWLTKAMFHYRWAYGDDIANAGPLLTFWHDPTLDDAAAAGFAKAFSERQIDRLWVVGSNETTAPVIEDSYKRLLKILDELITAQGYVLGTRPSSADFALYGQLTQLTLVDPTPARLARETAPRVRAWVDRVDDLSGLDPAQDGFLSVEQAEAALKPLLGEVGRVYAPFLIANAKALQAGEDKVSCEIDGREWTQKAFPYQGKCLMWLREDFAGLDPAAREAVRGLLEGTGAEALLA